MSSNFKVGGQHGVLKIDRMVDDTYYKFLVGKNPDGEVRQIVTRGPGKQNAATRIPIWIPTKEVRPFLTFVNENRRNLETEAVRTLAAYVRGESNESLNICDLTIPLVLMPREGNLTAGLEWNAPGGTGEVGETSEQIADREFDEEAGVAVIGKEFQFPPGMPASGIYDEVQTISFALIAGKPKKLTEGARGWFEVPLLDFQGWAWKQNQLKDPDAWHTRLYAPIDEKVILAVWWLVEFLK